MLGVLGVLLSVVYMVWSLVVGDLGVRDYLAAFALLVLATQVFGGTAERVIARAQQQG